MIRDWADTVLVRPLELADLGELSELDAAHAAAAGTEPVIGRASVHYFQRSGHSFVAERSTDPRSASPRTVGLVLAHSTWSGHAATVRVEYLVAGSSSAIAGSLLRAVVKSAYDAGVYRLVAAVPAGDEVARRALQGSEFAELRNVTYQRLLGAGALSGAGAGTTGSASAANDDDHGAASGAFDREGRGGEHDRQ